MVSSLSKSVSISSLKTQDARLILVSGDLYLLAFSNDRLFIQCVVYSIYALETAQTVLLTLHAFRAFGSGFGNPNALHSTGISWVAVGILGAMCMLYGLCSVSSSDFFFLKQKAACGVQLFYSYRILVISKRKTVAGVTSSVSLKLD